MTTSPRDVDAFAEEVGGVDAGPVVAVGGRTQFDVGGAVSTSARVVRAPVGIIEHEPAEMTVRVRAGTTVCELDDALGRHGQCVALPSLAGATVGGVLAVGHSGVRRLGWGPVRDTVLEVRYVSADGVVVRGGGPTVKNVSGYDLPRLLVGSLGTLGLLAEAVLRTRPVPPAEQWFTGDVDPFALVDRLHRPTAVLWNGVTTWLLLDGHPSDVAAQAERSGLTECDGPPDPSALPYRWSMRSSELRSLLEDGGGPFLAEVGVGVVHRAKPPARVAVDPGITRLHERVKDLFDPTGRLAPGRDPFADAVRGRAAAGEA